MPSSLYCRRQFRAGHRRPSNACGAACPRNCSWSRERRGRQAVQEPGGRTQAHGRPGVQGRHARVFGNRSVGSLCNEAAKPPRLRTAGHSVSPRAPHGSSDTASTGWSASEKVRASSVTSGRSQASRSRTSRRVTFPLCRDTMAALEAARITGSSSGVGGARLRAMRKNSRARLERDLAILCTRAHKEKQLNRAEPRNQAPGSDLAATEKTL